MSGCITTDLAALTPESWAGMPKGLKDITTENEQAMKEELNNRSRWLHVRLTQAEYKDLHEHFKASICRKMSDYARRMLLAKPVVAGYRNQSLDAFMADAIRLRKELNSVGSNLNQAVKKLHSLQHIAEVKPWIQEFQYGYEKVAAEIADIKKMIAKISDSWLQ